MNAEDRVAWEIHYMGMSIYTHTSGLWGNAPSSGVLIVVETALDGHKEVQMGMDFYYMDSTPSGNISAFLEADEDDFSFLPESGIKIGNWTSDAEWCIVHQNVFGV